MGEIYRTLPSLIDPVALSIGSFSLRWYALMYLAAFVTVYFLLSYRIRSGEGDKFGHTRAGLRDLVLEWMLYASLGLLVGARLGHVLFYNLSYYIVHPQNTLLPFDSVSGEWTGISGMSYFGGLVGTVLASLLFLRRKKIGFREWSDFVVPAIPAGYFFGRIGNFINGEMYGTVTSRSWGMDFGDGILRHPTQVYEAVLEGLVLFIFLWMMRKRFRFPGEGLIFYLGAYGSIRFAIEYWREMRLSEPSWLGLDLSQYFSLCLIGAALVLYQTGQKGYNGMTK